jgi:serine phosphatase RsbU (regulator of sigma subunit)/anti-sigma regulatory factor (Ser/Thr protein kinase)
VKPDVFSDLTNAELEKRLAERTIERDDVARDEAIAELARTNVELEQRLAERTIERDDVARDEALAELARTNAELKQRLAERTIERDDIARDEAIIELARTNAELEQRLAKRTIERDDIARDEAHAELARTNAELKQRLAERTIERDDVARDEANAELARTNAELKQRLAERTIERDDVARDEAHAELARTNAELKQRLAERTIERDDIARDEALAELARTNAELKQRLAERTIERDDVARDEAIAELARTNVELEQRLAERTIERDDVARDEALAELARTNAELKQRLAERTIEREHVARDEAIAELARTNAELEQRLAERTMERDDVARDEALAELARTNAELKQRLAERTIERDDVARDEAHAELARTNAELKQRLAERTIERDDVARDEALAELARTNAELKQRLAERTIERDDVARKEAVAELARTDMAQEYLKRELEREHRASAAFQEAALPSRMPIVPGMQFRAIYRAAKAEALVGGDWYDAFRLTDGRIVLSVGDVMGSGLLAAVTMGAVRQALRGAAQILAEPNEILDAADRALRSEQPDGIVTAFVGILDPITLALTYASAGHPPPLLRSATGDITTLGGSGLPLGLRSIHAYASNTSHTVVLDDSSLIVLYTDGLIEATRDIEVGEQKVRQALQSAEVWNAENPAAIISDRVLEEVLDDVAILTIRIESALVAVTRPAGLLQRDARWVFAVQDSSAATEARQGIVRVLHEYGATEAETNISELVFSELLGNVVRHGSDEVEFALDISGDAPVLNVLDRGPGFTYSARLPMDILSESGRGLFIVRALTHDLSIRRRNDGGSHTRAVLAFAIRAPHADNRVPASS